jgi:hypothetical protein
MPELAGAIDAGFNHSAAVSREGGRLYVWGKMQAHVSRTRARAHTCVRWCA